MHNGLSDLHFGDSYKVVGDFTLRLIDGGIVIKWLIWQIWAYFGSKYYLYPYFRGIFIRNRESTSVISTYI